ncbi:MAG: hypothetical protein WA415_10320, partial [Mycobacterium sp.]
MRTPYPAGAASPVAVQDPACASRWFIIIERVSRVRVAGGGRRNGGYQSSGITMMVTAVSAP